MNQKGYLRYYFTLISLIFSANIRANVYAQIIPDNTLGNERSSVNAIGNKTSIQGGATRGDTLFHSFKNFSIGSNESAIFKIDKNIINIFSRITGKKVSSINGLLNTSGNANLFLINPNGISIGSGARLDINASFLASTSNQFILNSNNGNFDILTNTSIPSNLKSFNSIDLVFTNSSKNISLNNFGHSTTSTPFTPLNRNVIPGFEVAAGKTLALFGANIISDGGILSAPSGNLIFGSLKNGIVNIKVTNRALEANLDKKESLGDISLLNRSLLNANAGGKIDIYGRNINIFDGSTIYIENLFNQTSGSINIFASGNIKLNGFSPNTLFRSSIFLDTIGIGVAPTITINTKNLFLSNSAFIGTRNFIEAQGGEIKIEASGLIEITKPSLILPTGNSQISSTTNSSKSSADINVSAKNISIQEGSNISSTTLSSGNSGDVNVKASESIVISGQPSIFRQSSISAVTLSSGNGGDVSVSTKDLTLSNGGAIASTALAQGNAGRVKVEATNSISLFGLKTPELLPGSPLQTTIDSNASIIPTLQSRFNLPRVPSGDSGQVVISSPNLFVSNGANIGAFNQGTGTAGNLTISSDRIELRDRGSISAFTFSGRGGNIQVLTEQLILKDGVISAAALGDGIGGNILINADLFVSFGESIISANAFDARGGNIDIINTFDFFPSPDTKITATSALGEQFDGNVTFSNPDRDLGLANTLVEAKPQKSEISSVCNPRADVAVSEFFRRGEGGLPMGATDQLTSASGWHDPSGESEQPSNTTAYTPEIVHIDDAQGLVINPDGTGSLVSYSNLPINKAEKPNNCNAKISPNTPTAAHPQPNRTGSDSTLSARPNTPETTTTKAPTHSSATTTP